ncbi:MAG: SAM-dependent chlorinase/fluorinase [Flavobacteriaceae bacterium]|jgi:S-adenosylmethionine hydrolase|nr:SAM-dependent chlorinase/fluorinase [Flavobacteriaceae bacterium]MDG2315089.1 SAM-dependent chlorinase/fluorinase [Flavobacteriaceae bacterium]
MSIITLTTDFGYKDHFVSAVKGAIHCELKDPKIIDISHNISPFNIVEGAYVLQNAFVNFPKGSIHIIGIDSEKSPENQHIAMLLEGHYFICANNGIMSLIAAQVTPAKVVEIDIHDAIQSNFTVLDVFVKVAAHISRGGTLDVIGKPLKELKVLVDITPKINEQSTIIKGSVLYVDNYGNVITNIRKSTFQEIGKSRSFTVNARNHQFNIIHSCYSDAIRFDIPKSQREEDGKRLALFNSAGYLELAIYKSNPQTSGSASSLFGLNYRDAVTITFD